VPTVVGVRFKRVGKVYHFDPDGLGLEPGDRVIVETARGVEFGEVVTRPREMAEEDIVSPLKKVIRRATPADEARLVDNERREKEADFRELVRDLASVFRTRIELRQIGVRDEAKMVGGLGPCGRPICCCTFLDEFQPITIKMAKEQNLSLNPAKISGVCGRLMCCLRYECETYEESKGIMPELGERVVTGQGAGTVKKLDFPARRVTVEVDGEMIELPADDVQTAGEQDG